MTPKEFHNLALEEIGKNYDYAWLIEAETKKGYMPIGVIYAAGGEYISVKNMQWFQWASKRNILEGMVNFFNKAREDLLMLGFIPKQDMAPFVHMCKYGIMRRVGTLYNMENEPFAQFQTRAK